MNIFRILFELFVIYMLYKLIFNFIIPVYKTTSQMKNAMHKAQEQMRQQQESQQPQPQKNTTISSDDYIDYEEVK